MKLFNVRTSLAFRLGALVAALLLGQQAMAEGTRAGTSIANTANVAYDVGTIPQTVIPSNTVTFVVDRRVDFTLEPIVPALEDVSPGEQNAWVDFRLTNLSNSELDFSLLLNQVASGQPVGPGSDGANLDNIEYAVSADLESATNPDPVQTTGPQFVDELPTDQSIRIRVWGDAALTLLNGLVAGVELTATAADGGSSGIEGGAVDFTLTPTDGGIENVAADIADGNGGVEVSVDGYIVVAAQLSVVKAFSIIDDGFGGTTNPLPGAEIEYTITITNASTTAPADNVVITDALDTDLEFLPDWSGTDDMTLSVNGAAATGCTEDLLDDSCDRSGQNLTFNIVSISASGSLVVTYRVTIVDPLLTP